MHHAARRARAAPAGFAARALQRLRLLLAPGADASPRAAVAVSRRLRGGAALRREFLNAPVEDYTDPAEASVLVRCLKRAIKRKLQIEPGRCS